MAGTNPKIPGFFRQIRPRPKSFSFFIPLVFTLFASLVLTACIAEEEFPEGPHKLPNAHFRYKPDERPNAYFFLEIGSG